MSNKNLAKDVGELGNITLSPIAFDCHCFYVRKTLTGEQVGESHMDRAIGSIVLPHSLVDYSNWCEVIGIGKNVGKPCSKRHMKKYERAKCLDNQVEVGDMVLIEDLPPKGFIRSPICNYEFFIEESVIKAIYKSE